MLKSDLYILCTLQNKSIWKMLHINVRTSWLRGWGYFLRPNFISQKVKVLSGTHLNTRKYSDCGINFETKVISLHKIEVLKITSFHLNMFAVHNF